MKYPNGSKLLSSMLKGIVVLTLVLPLTVFTFLPQSPLAASIVAKAATNPNNHPICSRLGNSLFGSLGLQMWCFGPQTPAAARSGVKSGAKSTFGSNVDVAQLGEDVSPSGAQAFGQSETSVAGIGPYAAEAWNDATSFFSPCPSPMNKEEGTGYGFSTDGGHSFVDEGGLPNTNCNLHRLQGDPSVEAWQSGGVPYFYISSLYTPAFSIPFDPRTFIAVNACKVNGTGSSATLSCGQPIVVAASTQCEVFDGSPFFCSFLDKEYMSIDPARGRLYFTYTEFGVNFAQPDNLINGQIELGICDIGNPDGTAGAANGTANAPVCFAGDGGSASNLLSPYFVVSPGDLSCEQEGAYPAVDIKTGTVYAAFEFNIGTNIFGSSGSAAKDCLTVPTKQVINLIPFNCLTLTPTSPCSGPTAVNTVNIVSMAAAFIPGYSRFPMNDFPRIAVSDKAGTVSIIWNDARLHPVGDILLQSFSLDTLTPIQAAPVRINSSVGGWHFLPALRQSNANGNLAISFYGRASANTAVTDVFAALNVSPLINKPPASNLKITTGASDWSAVSSDINPNFGDYTDNYLIATTSSPFVGNVLYIAWSDGRLGLPQPFEDHVKALTG